MQGNKLTKIQLEATLTQGIDLTVLAVIITVIAIVVDKM